MNRPTGSPHGLTLIQLAKLVFACAVACACITPLFRLVELGDARLGDVLPIVPVIVLLVWALLGFVLVGRGPRRSRLILALLLGVVLVSLGELTWASHALLGRVARYGLIIISPIRYPELALAVVGIPMLSGLGVFLALRLRALARGAGPRTLPRLTTALRPEEGDRHPARASDGRI